MTPHTDRAQLTRMTISNYRSIGENVSIDFEPLTVLVGTNGSGKSNLMDAPRFVAHALTDGLESAIEGRNGFDAMRRDIGGPRGAVAIKLELDLPDSRASYRIELVATRSRPDDYSVRAERLEVTYKSPTIVDFMEKRANGSVISSWPGLEAPVRDKRNLALLAVGGDERIAPVVAALRSIETYALFPEELRKPHTHSQRAYLTKFGDNWTSAVRSVMDTPAARDLRLSLERVTGDIVDLRVRRLGAGGFLVAEFGHARPGDKQQWFDAGRESDGTLRVAGILTALVQQPPLTMIGIEEPEQTVHAGVLPILVDFFDDASRASRVVVTTHSPELLDLVPPNAIRVVDRVDGTTRVGRLDEGQQALVKQRLASAGELLRSQGLLAEER